MLQIYVQGCCPRGRRCVGDCGPGLHLGPVRAPSPRTVVSPLFPYLLATVQKCHREYIQNRTDFWTRLQGKSESRGWKYARFLIPSPGSTSRVSCMEPQIRAGSGGFEKALHTDASFASGAPRFNCKRGVWRGRGEAGRRAEREQGEGAAPVCRTAKHPRKITTALHLCAGGGRRRAHQCVMRSTTTMCSVSSANNANTCTPQRASWIRHRENAEDARHSVFCLFANKTLLWPARVRLQRWRCRPDLRSLALALALASALASRACASEP